MAFNLKDYEEVKDRLPKFFDKYPEVRVITQLTHHSNDFSTVFFEAFLYANAAEQEKGLALATGWAYEVAGKGMVNKTSHVENCETSAIGRALANIGLHGSQRPSREEMAKVQRMSEQNKPSSNKDNTKKYAAIYTIATNKGVSDEDVKLLASYTFKREITSLKQLSEEELAEFTQKMSNTPADKIQMAVQALHAKDGAA